MCVNDDDEWKRLVCQLFGWCYIKFCNVTWGRLNFAQCQATKASTVVQRELAVFMFSSSNVSY